MLACKTIKTAKAKQREAEREIAQLQAQLSAIAAYEAALKGTGAVEEAAGRRGGKREEFLKLIVKHPDGMTRGDIKAGRVVQEGKTYKVREE